MAKKTQRFALISVYNKDGIDKVAKKLLDFNIKIISTGGTEKYLNKIGIETEKVEKLTDYPSIFGGRVKTLHPKIFGGILQRRDSENDNTEKRDRKRLKMRLICDKYWKNIIDSFNFRKS